MEEVLLFLLKQSAVVVALGVANWAQWKEKKDLKSDLLKLIESHNKEKNEMTAIIQSNSDKNTESLTRISVTMEAIKENIKNE